MKQRSLIEISPKQTALPTVRGRRIYRPWRPLLGEPGRASRPRALEARMRLRRTLSILAVSGALAGSGLLAAAAPASAAAPQYAKLYITPSFDHPGYYNVVVSGHFNTNVTQSTVGMRLKGDDEWFDDDLGVSRTGQAWYGDFSLAVLVWHGTLNEDWEGQDEIYASVSSSTGWSTDTNNVNGYF